MTKKSLLRFPVATLAAFALTLTGCADDLAAPELMQADASSAAMTRSPVCHVDELGIYNLITIADAAYEKHLEHGDAVPGTDIPGMPGYVYGDTDCTPEVGYDAAYGDVTWSAQNGTVPGYVTQFAVDKDTSGFLTHYAPDEAGILTLSIDCVVTDANEAWVGGTVATGTGVYADLVDDSTLFWFKDDDTGGDRMGSWSAKSCADAGVWTGSGIVTDGDLTVLN